VTATTLLSLGQAVVNEPAQTPAAVIGLETRDG
jgi:hypothetical protein